MVQFLGVIPAWITPLSPKLLDNIREGLRTHKGFESQFVAAAQMLAQIEEDTVAQLEHVERTNGEARAVVEELRLERLPSEIEEHIQVGIDQISSSATESDAKRWHNVRSMLRLPKKFISAQPIIRMMRETAFLVVRKSPCAPLYRSMVVDMIAVLNDVGELDLMLEAVRKEYQDVRKRYPTDQYEIDEVYGDEFSPLSQEARFIGRRSIKQRLASECLRYQ
jgi:hypothetical protein